LWSGATSLSTYTFRPAIEDSHELFGQNVELLAQLWSGKPVSRPGSVHRAAIEDSCLAWQGPPPGSGPTAPIRRTHRETLGLPKALGQHQIQPSLAASSRAVRRAPPPIQIGRSPTGEWLQQEVLDRRPVHRAGRLTGLPLHSCASSSTFCPNSSWGVLDALAEQGVGRDEKFPGRPRLAPAIGQRIDRA